MILLDTYATIYRLGNESGNKSSYTTLTTSLEATFQPSTMKSTVAGGGSEKSYRIFFDAGANVQDGDKIMDKDGNYYRVESGGVSKRNDGFIADYVAVQARKIN